MDPFTALKLVADASAHSQHGLFPAVGAAHAHAVDRTAGVQQAPRSSTTKSITESIMQKQAIVAAAQNSPQMIAQEKTAQAVEAAQAAVQNRMLFQHQLAYHHQVRWVTSTSRWYVWVTHTD